MSGNLRMNEQWRPQYHYTAEKNMINDPNGLIYYDGEWHLFHQYNQHEVVHWGHAVSADLLHWTHLPPAIYPNVHGQIYSGTAVVDHRNTSGLRTGADDVFVAFFTFADHHDGTQSQGLAFSNDRGRTWIMHEANPIIPNPGQKDFRDPKVFWHEPSSAWILVVTGGDHLEFFRSPDLLTWTYAFAWGAEHGSHGGVWECPDVFELAVDGETSRWVISVSVDRGAPAGGSGMQYFIGSFDGFEFVNENAPDLVLWQNWGKDYYAGITWENAPDDRRIMIAWTDNWLYRFDIPTSPFNGQLTLPRELSLVHTENGIRLLSKPVREVDRLRRDEHHEVDRMVSVGQDELSVAGDSIELLLDFDVDLSTADRFGVEIRVGREESTAVGYDRLTDSTFIDRRKSGADPHADFAGLHTAPGGLVDGHVKLRVFVDRSSVEVFSSEEQLSDLILPNAESTGVRLFAHEGTAHLSTLESWNLERVWIDDEAEFASASGEWAKTQLGLQGSSSARGVALLTASSSPAWRGTVEILGTRDRNPSKLLGQDAAGIIVGVDKTGATGTLVRLDASLQQLQIVDLATDAVLTTADLDLVANRPYELSVSVGGGVVTADVAGGPSIHCSAALKGERTAAYVRNAEAVFVSAP